MPLSAYDYQEYVDRLASRELKCHLDRSPTTMGPGYIADKIAEILEKKSLVNEMAERVEMALCSAEVRLNNLEEEVQLRTHLEYRDYDPDMVGIRAAPAREAYIWEQVEKQYAEDRKRVLKPGDPPVQQFQLSVDLSAVRSEIIELKALQRILNYRRDELVKLDSGVRLQQKTMDTEASIYGKEGKPLGSGNGDSSLLQGRYSHTDPSDLDDPGAMDEDEDFDTAPPPIVVK